MPYTQGVAPQAPIQTGAPFLMTLLLKVVKGKPDSCSRVLTPKLNLSFAPAW